MLETKMRGSAWTVRLFVALFIGLSIQFAFATPIFEAPDEPQHFSFVNRIANRWRLPNQMARNNGGAEQEGSQPPLFYVIAAVLITPFERGGLGTLREENPHAQTGNPATLANYNDAIQHEPYPPRFDPPRAAVYAVRLFNIIFGAITVWAVWKAAHAAAPRQPQIALLATGLTALNPQFAFISGAVNNDAMAAMWGSLVIWQTIVMLREGFSFNRSLVLGTLVALATMTKVSGLLFGGIVAIAAAYLVGRQRDWRGVWTLAVCGVAIWAVIAGAWYARNLHLYGDFTGTVTMLRWMGGRPPLGLGALIQELSSLTISYWGIFGWFNVLTPNLYYNVIDAALMLATAGVAAGLWRVRREQNQLAVWLFLLLTFGLGLGALAAWTRITPGTQGRLLFPYIAAINTLIAFGLTTLRLPPRPLLAALGIFAYTLPFGLIVPTYDPPEPVAELPAQALPFMASWAGQIAIVGHDRIEGTYRQGDLVTVTVYWQPLTAADLDYSLYLHLIDEKARIIGQIDSYPNGGLRRTTQWTPGVIYPDRYMIRLTEPVESSGTLRLTMGWYDFETGERLPAYDGAGEPAPFVILPAGIVVP
jgi:hypothetical protein